MVVYQKKPGLDGSGERKKPEKAIEGRRSPTRVLPELMNPTLRKVQQIKDTVAHIGAAELDFQNYSSILPNGPE